MTSTIKSVFTGDASGLSTAVASAVGSIDKLREKAANLNAALADVKVTSKLSADGLAVLQREAAAANAAVNNATKPVGTMAGSMKEVGQAGLKANAAMMALGGAAGGATGQVGKLVTGASNMAMAFATGGPLLAGIAAFGVLVSVIMDKVQEKIDEQIEAAERLETAYANAVKGAIDARNKAADALKSSKEELEVAAARAANPANSRIERELEINRQIKAVEEERAASMKVVDEYRRAFGDSPLAEHLQIELDKHKAIVATSDVSLRMLREDLKLQPKIAEQLERGAKAAEAKAKAEQAALEAAKLAKQLREEEFKTDTDAKAAVREVFAGLGADIPALPADMFPAVSGDVMNRLAGMERVEDPIVIDELGDAAKRAADELKRSADASARFSEAIGSFALGVGGAMASGSMPSSSLIGAAIGTAAAGPIGTEIGSVLGGALDTIGSVIAEPLNRLMAASAGGAAFQDAGGQAIATVLAGFIATVGINIIQGPLSLVLGPFNYLASVVIGLVMGLITLSTHTKQFADVAAVAGVAFEILIAPLGRLWSAFEPAIGTLLHVAEALAVIGGVLVAFLPIMPIVEMLAKALLGFAKIIMQVVFVLGGIVAQFDFERGAAMRRTASQQMSELKDFNWKVSGQEKFDEVLASLSGDDDDGLDPDDLVDPVAEGVERGMESFATSMVNVPTGWKGANAMFASSGAEGTGMGGLSNAMSTRGPMVWIENYYGRQNASLDLEALSDQARNGNGTGRGNRPRRGPFGDRKN